MWHKPCRTFHPWCLCIKTRCLYPTDCPTTNRHGLCSSLLCCGSRPTWAGMGYVWCQHWLPWWRQAYIRRLNSLRTVGINPLSPGASVILLTHCGLVTPYDIDLCQHWLRWRLFAWQHQAITWTSVDIPSMSHHLRAFFIRDTSTIN